MTTDYRKQKLQGRSFAGQTLEDVDFSGADLRGANFAKSTLTNVNFQNARFGQPQWAVGLVWLLQSLTGLMVGAVLIWWVVLVADFIATQPLFRSWPRYDLLTQNLTVTALWGSVSVWGVWRKNWPFALLTASMTAVILLTTYATDDKMAAMVGFAAATVFGVLALSALNAGLGGWAMTLSMLTVLIGSCVLILLALLEKAFSSGIVMLFIGPITAMLPSALSAYWANANVEVTAPPKREPLPYQSMLLKTLVVVTTLVGAFVAVQFSTGAALDMGSCIALALVGSVLSLLVFAGILDYLRWIARKIVQPMILLANTLTLWRTRRFLTSFQEAQFTQVDFADCDMEAANLHGSIKHA